MLQNKLKFWTSDEEWNFKTKDELIYIENISQKKVLEYSNDGDVLLKDFEEDKAQQLWKKGNPNEEGYFTLESQTIINQIFTLTAISSNSSILQLRGNITL